MGIKSIKKDEAHSLLLSAAKEYKNNLDNKNFMFVYRDGKDLQYIQTAFYPRCFCHLTGIYSDKLSSNEIYKLSYKQKLSPNAYKLSDNGTTPMKLQVITQAFNLDKTAKVIGEFNRYGFKLQSDKMIGNLSYSLGFVLDKSGYYVPNTLLKEDIRTVTIKPTSSLLCVFIKEKNEKQYNTVTLIDKKTDFSEIKLPTEVNALLTDTIIAKLKESVENINVIEADLTKDEKVETAPQKCEKIEVVPAKVETIPALEQENKMLKQQNAHMLEVINRTNEILSENPELKKAFVQAKQNHLERKQATKPDIDKKIKHNTYHTP